MSAITSKSVGFSAALHSVIVGGAIVMTWLWIGAPVVSNQERVIELFSGARSVDVADGSVGIAGATPRLAVFHYRPLPAYVPDRGIPATDTQPTSARTVSHSNPSKPDHGERMSYADFLARNGGRSPSPASAGQSRGPVPRVSVDAGALVGGAPAGSPDSVEDRHPGFFSALAGLLHDAYLPDQVSATRLTATIGIWIDGEGRIARTKLLASSGDAAFDAGVVKSALGLRVSNVPDDVANRWLTIHYQAQ